MNSMKMNVLVSNSYLTLFDVADSTLSEICSFGCWVFVTGVVIKVCHQCFEVYFVDCLLALYSTRRFANCQER